VQGPVLPLLPLLIATAFLALPRDGAWAVAALLVAGHAIVVLMQQLGWIGEPPFGPVFALGTAPGLLVLCAGVALAVVVGLSGRARFDRAGANLNRDNRVNPLTGLYEQGFLRERLETELERQRRQGGMLTLMLIEFDGFAPYTAEAGYDEGRRALQRAAEVLIENTRHDMDTPARYAATTFALLLPDARLEQAPEIAARIRAAMTEVSQGALRPRAGLACVTRAAEVSGDLVLATARRALQQSHTDAPPTQLQLPEKAG
jgi:diguanylate cyclase (GGDEF)-like protein